jgi:hypothetical protein
MKRVLWMIPLIILFSSIVHAQEIPAWELSGGYSYLRSNLNGTSFGINGGIGTLTENVNNWFGGRFEVAAYSGSESDKRVSAETITYGPVFSYRRHNKLTPFGQIELGLIHASAGYLGISAPATKFAASSGGGADFKLNERAAIRVQADYLITRFLSLTQDNVRVSAALVIRLGAK